MTAAVPAVLRESYRGSPTPDDIATSHRSADQRDARDRSIASLFWRTPQIELRVGQKQAVELSRMPSELATTERTADSTD
jgi:hypothetical protein